MITKKQFSTFEDLFKYYNKELFNGELPEVMINMSRKKNSHGFFAPERWKSSFDEEKKIHEISLNPDSLQRPAELWHSTLVHEMAHLWRQIKHGPARGGYHDKKWANKMEIIGLMPSDTGEPGGKKIGPHMTHYIIPGGSFERAFEMIQGEDFSELVLPYLPAFREVVITKKGTKTHQGVKVKYTCACGNNVWGKPDLKLTCDECKEAFEPAED